jgi:hypothetical protein
MSPPGAPTPISAPIEGQVLSWQWDNSRSALVVLTENAGVRRVYIMRTDGSVRDVTPTDGSIPTRAEWRN